MADASGANVAINAAQAELPACFAPGDQGLLGLRLSGLFGILIVSTIGVCIPAFTYKAKLDSVFFVLRAFAAGVVLTTGFVHVLADAYPILTDPCLGLSTEYPWAMAFATLSALLAFTLEWILHKALHKKMRLKDMPNGEVQQADDSANGLPVTVKSGTETLPVTTPEQRIRLKALHNVVMSYTFEIGIIFHSIFIGVTLGISSNADTVRALMIALFFHQGNEGLALGCLFIRAGYSRMKYVLFAAAFILVTPIGVAIGIGVSSNYNGESKAALGTEGVFDAVSAGILIYNGLVDLIVPTFSDEELPQSYIMQAVGFGAMYFGAAMMALIGKWA